MGFKENWKTDFEKKGNLENEKTRKEGKGEKRKRGKRKSKGKKRKQVCVSEFRESENLRFF